MKLKCAQVELASNLQAVLSNWNMQTQVLVLCLILVPNVMNSRGSVPIGPCAYLTDLAGVCLLPTHGQVCDQDYAAQRPLV